MFKEQRTASQLLFESDGHLHRLGMLPPVVKLQTRQRVHGGTFITSTFRDGTRASTASGFDLQTLYNK